MLSAAGSNIGLLPSPGAILRAGAAQHVIMPRYVRRKANHS